LQLLRGDGITGDQIALCLAGGFATAIIAILIAAHLYRSERLAISG
jgi:sodium transport system permease protein